MVPETKEEERGETNLFPGQRRILVFRLGRVTPSNNETGEKKLW